MGRILRQGQNDRLGQQGPFWPPNCRRGVMLQQYACRLSTVTPTEQSAKMAFLEASGSKNTPNAAGFSVFSV